MDVCRPSVTTPRHALSRQTDIKRDLHSVRCIHTRERSFVYEPLLGGGKPAALFVVNRFSIVALWFTILLSRLGLIVLR
jgi:hypothetical protein